MICPECGHTMIKKWVHKKPRDQWIFKPKPCCVCGGEYIPTASNQKYFDGCKKGAYRKLQKKREQKEYTMAWHRAKKKEDYQPFEPLIANSNSFKDLVHYKVMNRRGDTISVKSLTKVIFKRFGIELRPHDGEWVACYKQIRDIFKEHDGVEIGRSESTGSKFQFPR